MAKFVEGVYFEVEVCCKCGQPFAMTSDFKERRLNDHKYFYCPSGHRQYYVGKTKEQRLKERLSQKNMKIKQLYGENANLRSERNEVKKTYNRMRTRIKNGVCPCCDRTFQNLLEHIKTKHPEFGKDETLKAIRNQFGLTQRALANEIDISINYISKYERNKTVPGYAQEEIENWMENIAS